VYKIRQSPSGAGTRTGSAAPSWIGSRNSKDTLVTSSVSHNLNDKVTADTRGAFTHWAPRRQTRHLIGAEQLALIGPRATLVNTARGLMVEEAAPVQALKAGTLARAGLDVFEHEPEVHPDLLDCGMSSPPAHRQRGPCDPRPDGRARDRQRVRCSGRRATADLIG
jgi:hypothetical protein